jgi:hypothetical protein
LPGGACGTRSRSPAQEQKTAGRQTPLPKYAQYLTEKAACHSGSFAGGLFDLLRHL